jgi:4-amino-4-deoxy-L-arabinose transferase-like glycosyltransferase
VLAALLWGVAFTIVTKGNDDNLLDEGDAFYYGLTAANAANGNWFQDPFTLAPAADHGPLTTVVLVPTSWLFDGALAQRLTMTVFGALTVGAIGLLGREIGGPRVGLLAAVIALVNPNLWVNHALVMSEAVTGLLFALLLLGGYRLARRPTLGRSAAVGALCGLTVLTRAETALFLPLMIVPIVLLARDLGWWARFARIATATLCLVVVVAPWTVWLRGQFDEPVVVSTNDGLTLAGANCDETYYSDNIGFWSIDCANALTDPDLDASQNSARLRDEALAYARDHLSRVPLVVVAREGRTFGFWRPDQMVQVAVPEGRPEAVSWAGFVMFWILAPVAIAGAVQLRRRRVTLIPFGATLISAIVVSGLLNGIPRHRLGLDIASCALAAVALTAWLGLRGPFVGTHRTFANE